MKKSNKIIIGIIPTISVSENDPYLDNYHVVSMYMNLIEVNDAIALMLPIKDDHIDASALDICDAFILTGSEKINHLYYEVIDYALKNKRPLLGICAGMQALSIYSLITDKTHGYNELFWNEYNNLKESNNLLKKVDNHFHIVTKDISSYDNATHNININNNSIMYNAYGKNKEIVSLHSYAIKDVGSQFEVTAYSDDFVMEAIEYKGDNFIVGIQGHIEHDVNDKLFKEFINYINNKDY